MPVRLKAFDPCRKPLSSGFSSGPRIGRLLIRPDHEGNRLRRKVNLASPIIVFQLSRRAHEKISLFENPDSPVCQPRPASLSQGPLAIVTDVGSGMRWTALMSQTNGLDADGEDALSHRKLPAARAARETMRN